MKRILLRAGMSPFVNYRPVKVIMRNMIGNNIGNMLFQSSVSRVIMCEDTVIDTVNTVRKYSSEHVRQINENYDCMVLPFANAFRLSFIDELNHITALLKKIKIPCIVVGVGAQAELGRELDHPELAEAVKKFMKVILEKSNKVGLRGEFTADYLTKLGFQAERDFTVIGCPSLYMYGRNLPEMKVKELTPDSNVSMNSRIVLPQKFHDFMYRCSNELPEHHYIPQVIEEISQMYMGRGYPRGFVQEIPKHFPVSFVHPVYQTGKGITFTNLPSWLEYLRGKDFSFGSRIHGNIASILAGTPCFVVVSDKRVMELVEYHSIPHIMMKELKADTSIFDLYEKADFSAIRKNHEKHFMHYLDFLKENNLQTIFDEKGNAPEDCLYDQIVREVKFSPPVKAFSALTPRGQLKRLRAIYKEKRRIEGCYRKESMGVKDSIKDIFREMREEPNSEYQKMYPFIRKYKAAVKEEQMENEMDEIMDDGDIMETDEA